MAPIYPSSMPWNPDTYHQFREARTAPVRDLTALLDDTYHTIIDLGCGTGDHTEALAERYAEATVLGIDTSAEMLAHARKRARDNLTFRQQNILDAAGSFDLVFANASLQWLPHHPRLIPWVWSLVRPGGRLAVQVPSNFDHPSHAHLAATAAQPRFSEALGGWARDGTAPAGRQAPVLPVVAYAELLYRLGGEDITAFDKIYPVVLPDADGVLDWVSGTALVPYLERLPEDLRDDFREAYRERLWSEWPQGPVFYAFKRTLFSAAKPTA